MVGCQSKSQGTRYPLGLIVYDIVAVKSFDRYRNIALSIRAIVYFAELHVRNVRLSVGSRDLL